MQLVFCKYTYTLPTGMGDPPTHTHTQMLPVYRRTVDYPMIRMRANMSLCATAVPSNKRSLSGLELGPKISYFHHSHTNLVVFLWKKGTVNSTFRNFPKQRV